MNKYDVVFIALNADGSINSFSNEIIEVPDDVDVTRSTINKICLEKDPNLLTGFFKEKFAISWSPVIERAKHKKKKDI